jgi:hypothetical protein
MTEKYDVSNGPLGPSVAADDVLQTSSGSTGSKSSTISGGKARNWVSQIIALNKPPETPPFNGSVTSSPVQCVMATSTTFSHTVASGNNQMLIVTMGAENQGEDISATYDGVTMTKGGAHGLGTEAY